MLMLKPPVRLCVCGLCPDQAAARPAPGVASKRLQLVAPCSHPMHQPAMPALPCAALWCLEVHHVMCIIWCKHLVIVSAGSTRPTGLQA